MLSKMAKPEEKPYDYTYLDILKKDLLKSKVVDLKKYAKELNVKVSGNKDELIKRIQKNLDENVSAVKIQKVFRAHLVNTWIGLKGSVKNCVNDTDFYTMEPLVEIPFLYYIEHIDVSNNVKYGFNIKSLCMLASKNKKFENPYNRENLKPTCGKKMIRVIKLTNILFPNNDLIKDIVFEHVDIFSSITEDTAAAMPNQIFRNQIERLRGMTFDQRINELFIHIDSLGNYTRKEWLTTLNSSKLFILIVRLNHLWYNLPENIRNQVCPYCSPFSQAVIGNIIPDRFLLPQVNCEIVVKMAEIFVHSAVENENKLLGSMYFLSVLTLVSPEARDQLPWLYDNYFTLVQ
jgi:hypothetical protein